jgi:hypothetical protein
MEQTLINLLKLNFDLDDFYSITIHPDYHPDNVFLQGKPSPEKLLKYTKLGFDFTMDNDRFVAKKDRIRITLY